MRPILDVPMQSNGWNMDECPVGYKYRSSIESYGLVSGHDLFRDQDDRW